MLAVSRLSLLEISSVILESSTSLKILLLGISDTRYINRKIVSKKQKTTVII